MVSQAKGLPAGGKNVGMSATVTTAVIPAAGLGTRFLPATKATPKEMIPLIDKPAIQYVVEEAVRCGITDIVVVTGRNKSSMEDHFDRSPELEAHLEAKGKSEQLADMVNIATLADIHYVRQGEPLGLGHAVSMARRHVGDRPFAVMLGDDIMHERSGVLEAMIAASEERGASVVALKEVEPAEISAYGCAAVAPVDGPLVQVLDVVEKPNLAEAPSNLAVIGRYVLTPAIFDALEAVQPGAGGELQLTDAIKLLMAHEAVYGWRFTDGRFDVGNKLDYLKATIELALERDDLGPPLRRFLTELLAR
jgi:UTP--glucose-1-phosphate uridylyltransferase